MSEYSEYSEFQDPLVKIFNHVVEKKDFRTAHGLFNILSTTHEKKVLTKALIKYREWVTHELEESQKINVYRTKECLLTRLNTLIGDTPYVFDELNRLKQDLEDLGKQVERLYSKIDRDETGWWFKKRKQREVEDE